MKSRNLKLFLSAVLLFGGLSLSSCSDKEDNEVEVSIGINDLPSAAQTFLSTYFNGVKAESIERQSIGTVIMYNVELQNGFEIMFNSEGVWQEVDAPDGKTIPSGIAPQAIEEYVNEHYPDYGINEINKTGEGYNVELNGNVTLTFNELGEITGTIDDL